MTIAKSPLNFFALAAAAGIALAFFAPWVIVDADLAAPVGVVGKKVDDITNTTIGSSVTNAFRKAVSSVAGRKKLAHMSGFQIARTERNEFIKFAGEITVFFGGESKDPKKVRLLYLLPAAGLVLGLLIVLLTGWGSRIAGGLSGLVGAVMAFKLLTVPLGNDIAQAHLQWGIWTTVTLFILLGAAGLLKK